jgi:hypothetical protein
VAATEPEIVTACEALPNELAIATMVAFNLGQRIGDVMMLEKSRKGEILDPHSKAKGKTIRRRDPYTLHIPSTDALAPRLLALAKATPTSGLFTTDKASGLKQIRTALTTTNSNLCLLSIRRGGLQRMAQQGASTETLLAFSRHCLASDVGSLSWLGHLEPQSRQGTDVTNGDTNHQHRRRTGWRKYTRHLPAADPNWPIHAKHVEHLNMAHVLRDMNDIERASLSRALRFFTPEFLRNVPCSGKSIELSPKQVEFLIKCHLLKIQPPGSTTGTKMHIFLVDRALQMSIPPNCPYGRHQQLHKKLPRPRSPHSNH